MRENKRPLSWQLYCIWSVLGFFFSKSSFIFNVRISLTCYKLLFDFAADKWLMNTDQIICLFLRMGIDSWFELWINLKLSDPLEYLFSKVIMSVQSVLNSKVQVKMETPAKKQNPG